jgi:hypothetical protein
MTARKRPHSKRAGRVSIEIDGKAYRGAYVVSRSPAMITVVVEGAGKPASRTKIAVLGNSPAEGLARIMLREMVEDAGA